MSAFQLTNFLSFKTAAFLSREHQNNKKNMLKIFQEAVKKRQKDAEKLLWHHLRSKRFFEFDFRHQCIINGYTVDFVCLEKKLVIELDDWQNLLRREADLFRSHALMRLGFRILRLYKEAVLESTESILDVIYNMLMEEVD